MMELLSASSLATVFRVPNEKRILYKRHDHVQRVVGGNEDEKSASTTNSRISGEEASKDTQQVQQNGSGKCLPLEKAKTLELRKPMIGPRAPSRIVPGSFPNGRPVRYLVGPYRKPLSYCNRRRRKIGRPSVLPPIQLWECNPSCTVVYPRLEPGEVPPPDYGPKVVPVNCPPSMMEHYPEEIQSHAATSGHSFMPYNSTSNAQNGEETVELGSEIDVTITSAKDVTTDEMWIPPSNPMKEVFNAAKVGFQKIVENCKQCDQSADVPDLLLIAPPPIRAETDARKRKRPAKRPKNAPQSHAGVCFKSKGAEMGHFSNRWVKGGRLTTTGEFEEVNSDEGELLDDCAEVGRTLRQLEAIPASMNDDNGQTARQVQLHVMYEDTSEYAEYAKWYGSEHGQAPSYEIGDECQQRLRQWYQYYRSAVKFWGIDDCDTADHGPVGAEDIQKLSSLNDEERNQILMQQWRWKQINEWELRKRSQQCTSSTAHQPTQEASTDGVTIAGKPVTYSSS